MRAYGATIDREDYRQERALARLLAEAEGRDPAKAANVAANKLRRDEAKHQAKFVPMSQLPEATIRELLNS